MKSSTLRFPENLMKDVREITDQLQLIPRYAGMRPSWSNTIRLALGLGLEALRKEIEAQASTARVTPIRRAARSGGDDPFG